MQEPSSTNPITAQEEKYHLPYHWFPVYRHKWYERKEKRRLVFELISNYAPKPVERYLDVGCGDGKWTSDIAEQLGCPVAVGVDISDRAIGFARLITPSIDFRVGHANGLPFEDESFDLVSMIEVLEHIPDNDEVPVLSEVRRVLSPNGLFLITVPSTSLRMPDHHFRHYTLARLSSLLSECGYDVLEAKGQSLPWYGAKRRIRSYAGRLPFVWKLWNFTYGEVLPDKATNLLVAARPSAR